MEKKLLGFHANGKPIYPTEEGMITTACILSCSECGDVIKSMGGPSFGAICIDCMACGDNHPDGDENKG